MSEQISAITLKRREWNETLTIVRFPNFDFEALLPSKLDLVNKDAQIAECEREINRCQHQPPPPEIQELKEALAKGEYDAPEDATAEESRDLKAQKADAERKVEIWRQRREAETEGWQTVMWRYQDALERMNALAAGQILMGFQADGVTPITVPLGQDGGERMEITFRLRRFTFDEKIQADEHNTRLDLSDPNHRTRFDKPRRNLELLGVSIRGVVKATHDGDMEIPLDAQEVQPVTALGLKTVSELDDTYAETLIERLWAKMQMDPQLVGYFRRSGRSHSEQPGSGGGDPV